jgi:hypothetical protein
MSNNSNIFSFLRNDGVDGKLIEFLNLYCMGKKEKLRDKFTNHVHYEVFKYLPLSPTNIYVSNNYVVLEYVRTYERGRRYWKREVNMRSMYLVGVNSDGKLFINKVLWNLDNWKSFGKLHFKNGCDVEVFSVEDRNIWRNLGYEYDCEISKNYSIPVFDVHGDIYRSYRVQGDLILVLTGIEDAEKRYMDAIRVDIFNRVYNHIKRVILERISGLLSQYYIATEMHMRNRDERLLSWAIPRRLKYDEVKALFGKLGRLIEKELYISDISQFVRVEDDYSNDYWGYSIRPNRIDVYITLKHERGEFGYPYEPIEINVELSNELINKYVDDIMKELDIECDRRVIYIGRHKFDYIGYPSSFIVTTKLPLTNFDGINDDVLINVNIGEYFIEKGKMKITHIEHGEYEYKVNDDILVAFTSTSILRENDSRFTYHALKNLKI